jgi:hypothetical protein
MRQPRNVSTTCLALSAFCFVACGEAGDGSDGNGAAAPSNSAVDPFAPPGAMTLNEDGVLVPTPGVVPTGEGPVATPTGSDGPATPDMPGVVPVPGEPAPGETPTTPTPSTELLDCSAVDPGPAPLRRMTRFEYNNTISDLLGDTTQPANSLPSELLGNGYGNDGDEQPVSSFLAEQYGTIAEDIVARTDLAAKFPCTADATDEAACVGTIIETFGARAYRRQLDATDIADLTTLYDEVRVNGTFEESVRSLLVAILQSPDYLYRVEWGVPDAANPALLRPSPSEMAARLSYFFWGTMPDPELEEAARSGELATSEGVRAQAERLLGDDKARPVLRYFFDHFLPINTVTDLARDPELYPSFDNNIGSLMREETHGFLQHEIFEGEGTWKSALTAPYVFVNEELANYYGIPNVTGPEFRKVDVDPMATKRMGLLTQGAVLAGTTVTNFTNPVRRGGFVIRELMCYDIQLPTDPETLEAVKPPEPFIEGVSSEVGRETARMRYEEHRNIDGVCITCHAALDPPGFALENFDAVGLWRDQENGVTIDASGDIPMLGGAFTGPFDLVQNLAETDTVYSCFATNWTKFAYGRKVNTREPSDACLVQDLRTVFEASGYDIQEMLLALTQTDAFLYLPTPEVTQ